jgi:Ser/Thr protein kinase RdoA (MazF antagonist)
VPVRVPRIHAVESVGDGRYFALLLEDVASPGVRFSTVGDRVELEDARRVVGALAALHAAFWESPRFEGDLAWVPCRENRRGQMAWERFVTGQMIALARRRYGGEFDTSFEDVAALCSDERDRLERMWATGPRTLVHGDCHVGNLFFEPEAVGFLDWQICARAPGMRDVSYFLCNSFPSQLRAQHERELIEGYLGELRKLGVAAPGFEEAWSQHRLFALYTWIAAAFTAAAGGALQPPEIGLAGLRRATRAVGELQSVAHVRELEAGRTG